MTTGTTAHQALTTATDLRVGHVATVGGRVFEVTKVSQRGETVYLQGYTVRGPATAEFAADAKVAVSTKSFG